MLKFLNIVLYNFNTNDLVWLLEQELNIFSIYTVNPRKLV